VYKLVLSFLLAISLFSCSNIDLNQPPLRQQSDVLSNQSIIKSQNDKRLYKSITLNNKLKVLLISE